MIGFDIWWQEQLEKLDVDLTWEQLQAIKELAESEYERGYWEGVKKREINCTKKDASEDI